MSDFLSNLFWRARAAKKAEVRNTTRIGNTFERPKVACCRILPHGRYRQQLACERQRDVGPVGPRVCVASKLEQRRRRQAISFSGPFRIFITRIMATLETNDTTRARLRGLTSLVSSLRAGQFQGFILNRAFRPISCVPRAALRKRSLPIRYSRCSITLSLAFNARQAS